MNAINFSLHAQRRIAIGLYAILRVLINAPVVRAESYPVYATMLPTRPRSGTLFTHSKQTAPACPTTLRPLRVLRVMEPNQQHTCVGRMVISGRMADVCAELDRLASRETAAS